MKAEQRAELEKLEARMLSGEPFTYGGLCAVRAQSLRDAGVMTRDGDHDRLIDRTIQRLRRKGLIAFTREAGKVVWRLSSRAKDQSQ